AHTLSAGCHAGPGAARGAVPCPRRDGRELRGPVPGPSRTSESPLRTPPPPQRVRVINRRPRHADVGAAQGSLRDVERAYVQRVLAECSTLEEAARHLAINPATLWRKRKRWGLV